MIEGLNIVCFSDDWGRHPSSCQHLMGRLSQKNKVLWVNTIGMRNPTLTKYDILRIGEKILSWLKPLRRVHKNLYVYSVPMLPYNNLKMVRWLNKQGMIITLKWLLRYLKMKDPILWTSVPNVVDIVGLIGERKDVFYCYDEFSKWPGISHKIVTQMEQELIEKVDLILTTSTKLYQEKKSSKCHTYLLPHGVDLEHFAKVSNEETEIAEEILNIKKPIIGFYGVIDERMDRELIRYIASSLPDVSIVFLGRRLINLPEAKNIHFLDEVPYERLPNYVKAFDVCIIPYLVNELSKYINPLKFKEYLATGKPVVSTPLEEVLKYKEVIKIAANKEDFVNRIKWAIKEDKKETIKKRQNSVKNESWETKVEEVSNYLQELLRK